jgi:hypothetical protein
VYDLKKQKSELLKFYAGSDTPKAMRSRETLNTSRVNDVDRVSFECFRRRSEGVPVSGLLLIQQAKKFHDLKINKACDYSQGWLHRFKLHHEIRKLSLSGEKLSADSDAAGKFVEEFMKLISDENLTAEQIYNADETGLFWRSSLEDTCSWR